MQRVSQEIRQRFEAAVSKLLRAICRALTHRPLRKQWTSSLAALFHFRLPSPVLLASETTACSFITYVHSLQRLRLGNAVLASTGIAECPRHLDPDKASPRVLHKATGTRRHRSSVLWSFPELNDSIDWSDAVSKAAYTPHRRILDLGRFT